jgi:hypothetical protein
MSQAVSESPTQSASYEFLNAKFLEAMDDIGRYGNGKYGKDSFHQRAKAGDRSRGTLKRTEPAAIAQHAEDHFKMHLRGELHDHFHTRKHQLAAVAFNAMMEFYFAGLEDEAVTDTPPVPPAQSH